MADDSCKKPDTPHKQPISRRDILRKSLTGAALAAGSTALGGWGPRAETEFFEEDGPLARYGKVPKEVAHYQYHPNGPQHCAICRHFRGPDHCEIVAGRIVPNGWCRYFRYARMRGGYGGGGGGRY